MRSRTTPANRKMANRNLNSKNNKVWWKGRDPYVTMLDLVVQKLTNNPKFFDNLKNIHQWRNEGTATFFAQLTDEQHVFLEASAQKAYEAEASMHPEEVKKRLNEKIFMEQLIVFISLELERFFIQKQEARQEQTLTEFLENDTKKVIELEQHRKYEKLYLHEKEEQSKEEHVTQEEIKKPPETRIKPRPTSSQRAIIIAEAKITGKTAKERLISRIKNELNINYLSNPNLYALLGLDPKNNPTPIQLRRAYRRASLKYHPDRNPDPAARDKFEEAADAYRVLSNDKLRATYDAIYNQNQDIMNQFKFKPDPPSSGPNGRTPGTSPRPSSGLGGLD